MVAPKKLKTKTRDENLTISGDIIKAIKKSIREQKIEGVNKVLEVKVEVFQVGHGARPFGTHFPNDYIDFTIRTDGYKVEGLGLYDLSTIGNLIKKALSDKVSIEMGDLFFSYGNFTPDMEFPTWFRVFTKPCKEFVQLAKLVKGKYGIELKVDTLYRNATNGKIFIAYYPQLCSREIDLIKSYGRTKTTCEIINDNGTELYIRC